ncbi:pogo transposable element with KRAB domain protein, putative [Rhizoctonia solani AG-3 Rhs1AP]|uniref:Pogo transposable element with KRAB domain protein, putative n=2 Tax=Rhizoctonia solani AG-3 TaxID=1086053 RepID=X8JGY2_9AGAM|nr:pogo transposable element with KRAB domain protein, putative [Rhizoctonia solani AG-3 Rhs1AP]KEP45093.1 putative pogo transposable element with KRAB domain protein [Rhizoctonia solani 123E]
MSARWVQRFMQDQLGWSYRTATKAARKRPNDWEAQGLLAFLRMVKTIDHHRVQSPCIIVNADQTGISLLPTGKKTWDTIGKDQVSSINHDERQQFTLVVASSCGGDILPFQSVWSGKSDASLPKPTASRRAEADQLKFTFTHGDTCQWSSLQTIKEWVETTLMDHYNRVREEEYLPDDSLGILYIDAWPVHTGKSTPDSFIPWMTRNYPWIKLIFVPVGCK